MSCETVQIQRDKIELRRPREWGTCWLGLYLWDMLELGTFWKQRLPSSRGGTSWLNILKALTCYRLIDPGSEFRFHREWYLRSAMGDLLRKDYSLAQKDKPYRCLDLLLKHRDELFGYLKGQWGNLFGAKLEEGIEAHIFVSFLAYCLHTTLRNLARGRAAGLTSEAILKKLSNIQMIDIHLPTTDGRHVVMSRYTQPEKDVSLLLAQLGLTLPDQPPPKVYATGQTGL
ncbi:MAG: hypothetical protein HS132_13340 [Planctomycetia bacterium]|nr:hypothetical protein [Planctomycetia bacterium]